MILPRLAPEHADAFRVILGNIQQAIIFAEPPLDVTTRNELIEMVSVLGFAAIDDLEGVVR